MPHATQAGPAADPMVEVKLPGPRSWATGRARSVFRLDQPIVITIDGPAGTGKSSVARLLALELGLDFLDTGAMYRAAAMIAIQRKIPLADAAGIVAAVAEADLHFDWSLDPPELLAWDQPLGQVIRSKGVTDIVSAVAGIKALRAHLVERQRHIARLHPRLVTEGRDQGSVVFPDAKVKFYLDASAAVRAARRAQQLRESGQAADEAALQREIEARDKSDMSREVGPLIRPEGAIVIDTSSLARDDVVSELAKIIRQKADEA